MPVSSAHLAAFLPVEGQVSRPRPADVELDFAANTIVGSESMALLDQAYTIARSTQGYVSDAAGNVSAIAIDMARLSNKGVRIDAAYTQRWSSPNELDDAAWTKQNGSSVENAGGPGRLAPDGTMTLREFIPSTTPGAQGIQKPTVTGLSFATKKYFTIKIKTVRPNAYYDTVHYNIDSGSGTRKMAFAVDPKTGAVVHGPFKVTSSGSVGNLVNTYSEPNGDGSFDVSITMEGSTWPAVRATVSPGPVGYVYSGSSSPNFAGDGVRGMELWGFNLVQEEFRTEFTPVTTAQSADIFAASAELMALLNAGDCTVQIETRQLFFPIAGGVRPLIDINAGEGLLGQMAYHVTSTVGGDTIKARLGGGAYANGGRTVYTVLRKSSKGRAICANGGAVARSRVQVPELTAMALLQNIAGDAFSNGYLLRIKIWNRALSDDEMRGASLNRIRPQLTVIPGGRQAGVGSRPEWALETRVRPISFAAGVASGLIPANTLDFASQPFADIDAAIDAALAADKRLALPAGTYYPSGLKYAVSLYGYGASKPIIKPPLVGVATSLRGFNYYGDAPLVLRDTEYQTGDLVKYMSGSEARIYQARIGGVTASTGGPTSNTTGVDIVDGGVTWQRVNYNNSLWMALDDYDVEIMDVQIENMGSLIGSTDIPLPLLVTESGVDVLKQAPYVGSSTDATWQRTNASPANYLGQSNSQGSSYSRLTRQIATIRVSGAGDLTALIQERQTHSTTNRSAGYSDVNWAAALDASAEPLIGASVVGATPASVAAAINDRTAQHGMTATLDSEDAQLLRITMGYEQRPLWIGPTTTGDLTLECVCAHPNVTIQNCSIINCDNVVVARSDVTAFGEVRLHDNGLTGTWNFYDIACTQVTKILVSNNLVTGVIGQRQMRQNSNNMGWGTIGYSGVNAASLMRYSAKAGGQQIKFENNEVTDIVSVSTSNDINCPSVTDNRCAFAANLGDISVSYNLFRNITNLAGGNNGTNGSDCNAIYWKTLGMLIEGNGIDGVGVPRTSDTKYGSEGTFFVGKAAVGAAPTGYSMSRVLIRYNNVTNSPMGCHIGKAEGFEDIEICDNRIDGWDEWPTPEVPASGSTRGMFMIRGGPWDRISIHSNLFLNIKNLTRLVNFHVIGDGGRAPYDAANFQVFSNRVKNDGVNADEFTASRILFRIEFSGVVWGTATLQTSEANYRAAMMTGFNELLAANDDVVGVGQFCDKDGALTAQQGTGTAVDVPYALAA